MDEIDCEEEGLGEAVIETVIEEEVDSEGENEGEIDCDGETEEVEVILDEILVEAVELYEEEGLIEIEADEVGILVTLGLKDVVTDAEGEGERLLIVASK